MVDSYFSNGRPCLCKKLAFLLAVFSSLLILPSVRGGENSKSFLSVQELKGLAPMIEAAEKKPKSVKIEAEIWVETKTDFYDPCELWKKTPIHKSYTAWVDGGSEGKERMDVHKDVTEWLNGSAPYVEESYSMSFDGQQGRYINKSVGPLGQAHPVTEGEILPEAPKRLGRGAGIYWSLSFFNGEMYSFSKIFKLASEPNSEAASELEFSFEEFEGAECIKIRSKLYYITYWLDPSHGFALRGRKSMEMQNGHEELAELVKVTKLKEVSGVWWPMEVVTVKKPYEPGKPWRQYIYRSSDVTINDPNFDSKVFAPTFPKGHRVKNKITGKNYIVDANLDMIEEPNNPRK
jgi:hypothetical protein